MLIVARLNGGQRGRSVVVGLLEVLDHGRLLNLLWVKKNSMSIQIHSFHVHSHTSGGSWSIGDILGVGVGVVVDRLGAGCTWRSTI